MRLKLVFPLLVALLIPAALLAENPQTSRAPVLFAEVNNSGDVTLFLAVYNDGEAILARKDADEPDGELCTSFIPAGDLANYETTLREVGALRLRDAASEPDFLRKTVTFFAGPDQQGRAHSNSFTYYRIEGPYLTVQQTLARIISNHFRSCL